MRKSRRVQYLFCGVVVLGLLKCSLAPAQQSAERQAIRSDDVPSKNLDQAVEKALVWLASEQQADGSFPAMRTGQPGITSLVALAFLSAGHLPGTEPHGTSVENAIAYALTCEQSPGLFTLGKPGPQWQFHAFSHTAYYNQAITGLMLAEVSGEVSGTLRERVIPAVKRTLAFTQSKQYRSLPKRPQDEGGWRYPPKARPLDSYVTDLSITAWQVTFLRSAKNAGFDVSDEAIQSARRYVKGLYKPNMGTFTYDHRRTSRGMTGAGIVAMAMLGLHDAPESKQAAAWLMDRPFADYGQIVGQLDRFQYSVYYCTQGMYHLGDDTFQDFFPEIVQLLLKNQQPDGSWRAVGPERALGDAYATAMSVLALSTRYAMLPIHQR